MRSTRRRIIGRLISGLLSLLACCCTVSCKQIPPKETSGSSLLPPQTSSPETVGVDVYFVRIPSWNRELLQQLWSEVDEQWGSPTLRRELMNQGLRIGIQGVSLSPTLSKLINATATPTTTGDPMEVSVAELQKDTIVDGKHRRLMPGMQALFRPYADSVPEMPLFWTEDGRFCGKTFRDAQGLIGVVATPTKNGHVRFDITPEVVHGSVETKYSMQGGVMFPEVARPKHVFYNLSLSLELLPGQWIVIGPVSENCSGVGRCFFTRNRGETEQKVILIRLIRTQRDALFDTMPLPEVAPDGESKILERY